MIGPLLYCYVGCGNVGRDLDYYRDVLGAELLWDFSRFGTRVAAVRLGEGPPLLLAGHREAPSVMLIYGVADLAAEAEALVARGWRPDGTMVEVPEGPVYTFHDPSGNALALLQQDRPGALDRAWADEGNFYRNRQSPPGPP